MSRPLKDRHCSYCGTAYLEPLDYPRRCPSPACAIEVWANPIPVCVVLVPVRLAEATGLLVLRRGIEPQKGTLALPGGFLEEHETWQQGGAREVREELEVVLDSTTLDPFWYASTTPRPNRVLLFATAAALDVGDLPRFTANHEAAERGVVLGPDGLDDVVGFSLHAEAARRWFASLRIGGAHDYRVV
jgi:ADP-ribose pyrophosphatase YjhB (NUDIX family)